MPVRNAAAVDQDSRASWFSHKSEIAKPYYYQVYLADHDINAELAPTDRAAAMQFTFPESETSGVIVDAYDQGSFIKVLPQKQAIIGYTTKNCGGVPENFRNWFVVKFDKPFERVMVYDGPSKGLGEKLEFEGNHALAAVSFRTKRDEKVGVKAASSFISLDQAWLNLEEVGDKTFAQVKAEAKGRWNEVLGRIQVGGGSDEQYRTFYSCLYRATLFPRKFYEINSNGNPVHYSPYDGQIHNGYMYTDTGFWDTFRALFPLLNLVYPSVNAEIQQGLANIARENKFLPEWSSPGHRGCMVGNNSASVVADAILKGITPEEDWQTLYDCIVY
jgi:predicted alpha-1,2-mannosidase